MFPLLKQLISSTLLLLVCLGPTLGQSRTCKRTAFAALKPAPELTYQCGEGNNYDEKQLKDPARLAALKSLISELSTWTTPAWWQTSVADLNACEFRGEPGDHWFWLFGNNQIRLVLVPDPCYQTEYNG